MKTCAALLLLLLFMSAGAQNFKKHVAYLASEQMHGRAPGSADELRAATYIANGLPACTIIYQHFAFKDTSQKGPIVRDTATNLIGFLDCGKDSTIIISAHYDHLGYGSNKSLDLFKKGIHPGADDNASGVAMMLELARYLASGHRLKYNFVFAAYSAHEAGLLGSAYFAQSTFCQKLKIRAIINMDMVGRLDTTAKVLRISGFDTDSAFARFFNAHDDNPIHFRYDDANLADSDLKPFKDGHIALLNLTTGTHTDYHRSTDTEDKINYPGMLQVYTLLQQLLVGMAME